MKFRTRALALLAGVCLLAGLLASCGSKQPDPIKEAFGYPGSTVFATLGSDKITAEDYLPWLANYATYISQSYNAMGGQGVNWDEDMGDGTTAREYMKTQIMETVKFYSLVEALAKKEGVKLSDENKKTLETNRAQTVESLGGEEQYALYLKSLCLTDEGMQHVNGLNLLAEALGDALCGEGKTISASEEELRADLEEKQILAAKHILLLTKDPAVQGPAYSAEKIAEQKTKAEGLLAQLRAAEDPAALFDTLMQEHSEDSGLATNPNGYVFTSDPANETMTHMVPAFEQGTAALEVGAISEIVESDYGYHIIMRIDPLQDPDLRAETEADFYSLKLDAFYKEKLEELEFKTTEAYDQLDPEAFWNSLQEYTKAQEEALLPKEDAKPESGDDANPADDENPATGDEPQPEGATGDEPQQPTESEPQPEGGSAQTPPAGGEAPAQ